VRFATQSRRASISKPFAAPGVTDAVDSIFKDLYSAVRTSTFHAKVSKPTLLPLDVVDRQDVLDALARLAGLYLKLVEHVLSVRRPGGGMFQGGFDMLIGDRVAELEVWVTDDPVPMEENQKTLNPEEGSFVRLPRAPRLPSTRPSCASFSAKQKSRTWRSCRASRALPPSRRTGTP
jgi:hypothetical protein